MEKAKKPQGEEVVTTLDIERIALKKLPEDVGHFFADGADLQQSLRGNRLGYFRLRHLPRLFRGVAQRDQTGMMLGSRLSLLLGFWPTSFLKMVHPEGQKAAARELLPDVVRVVGDRCEVNVDGSILMGTDITKALSLGARAVFVGRLVIWGLAYDGQKGVENRVNIFKEGIYRAMALLGCSSLADLTPDLVVQEEYFSKL